MCIEYHHSEEVSESGIRRSKSVKVGRIVFVAFVVMVIALACLSQPRIRNFWVSGGGIETKTEFEPSQVKGAAVQH